MDENGEGRCKVPGCHLITVHDNTEYCVKHQKNDAVNHPSHYTQGKFEVIDVIEDWKLGFHLANTVKYIARAEHKENAIQDLKKAAWYLNRKIELLEGKHG